jgi:hypothetical protein
MTKQERNELLIEKLSLQEVIKQFTKGSGPDARMSIDFDAFLCSIEKMVREIDSKLNGT